MAGGQRLSACILEAGLRGAGAPSHWNLFGRLAPKDHKWLVHTRCQHSFVSEDDKRLGPSGCLHGLLSKEDERLVASRSGSLNHR